MILYLELPEFHLLLCGGDGLPRRCLAAGGPWVCVGPSPLHRNCILQAVEIQNMNISARPRVKNANAHAGPSASRLDDMTPTKLGKLSMEGSATENNNRICGVMSKRGIPCQQRAGACPYHGPTARVRESDSAAVSIVSTIASETNEIAAATRTSATKQSRKLCGAARRGAVDTACVDA